MIRPLVGAIGATGVAYGGWRLWELGWENLRHTVVWLAGGVVLHDALVVPLVLGLWVVLRRGLPGAWRARLAATLIILGTVTLGAVPVLLRLGARADNTTLLDRDYGIGWLILAAAVTAGVLLAHVVGDRMASRRRSARDTP